MLDREPRQPAEPRVHQSRSTLTEPFTKTLYSRRAAAGGGAAGSIPDIPVGSEMSAWPPDLRLDGSF